MPSAPIAGPRRTRAAASPAPPLTRHPATRPLPPLDYDDPGRGDCRSSPIAMQPATRRKARSWRWLLLGIAVGALGGMLASGNPRATLRSLRFWGADILRSLERNPRPTAPVGSPVDVCGDHAARVAKTSAPCPLAPGPGGACGELPAPLANDPPAAKGASPPPALKIPTVSIDDLPRVKPARVAAFARPHRAAKANHGDATSEGDTDGDGNGNATSTDSPSGRPDADDAP